MKVSISSMLNRTIFNFFAFEYGHHIYCTAKIRKINELKKREINKGVLSIGILIEKYFTRIFLQKTYVGQGLVVDLFDHENFRHKSDVNYRTHF